MFAENLKRLRSMFKFSQEELGSRLIVNGKPVSGKTIWSWETGRTEPNMGAVQQLADIFGITIDELLSDKPTQLPLSFDNAQDAYLWMMKLPVFAAYGGKNISEMSDDEKIRFANRVLRMMKALSEEN